MNDFTTEILKTLANKGDLNELFRVHLEKAVQKFLGRSHKGFQQAEGELEQMLSQLIEN